VELEVQCYLCKAEFKLEVELPEGWHVRDTWDQGLCPKHAVIEKWREEVCPGCAGAWNDCNLWRSFAYSSGRNITEEDLSVIEQGYCPKRVNGTFSLAPAQGALFESIDISGQGSLEGGKAFAQAIREYMETYPEENDGEGWRKG